MLHGINHIALPVRNLEVSDRFYREILGLCPVGGRPGMKFYTAGLHHHDLALIETGEIFPVSGFAHFCLDVEDEQSLAAIYACCRAAGARILWNSAWIWAVAWFCTWYVADVFSGRSGAGASLRPVGGYA